MGFHNKLSKEKTDSYFWGITVGCGEKGSQVIIPAVNFFKLPIFGNLPAIKETPIFKLQLKTDSPSEGAINLEFFLGIRRCLGTIFCSTFFLLQKSQGQPPFGCKNTL